MVGRSPKSFCQKFSTPAVITSERLASFNAPLSVISGAVNFAADYALFPGAAVGSGHRIANHPPANQRPAAPQSNSSNRWSNPSFSDSRQGVAVMPIIRPGHCFIARSQPSAAAWCASSITIRSSVLYPCQNFHAGGAPTHGLRHQNDGTAAHRWRIGSRRPFHVHHGRNAGIGQHPTSLLGKFPAVRQPNRLAPAHEPSRPAALRR